MTSPLMELLSLTECLQGTYYYGYVSTLLKMWLEATLMTTCSRVCVDSTIVPGAYLDISH